MAQKGERAPPSCCKCCKPCRTEKDETGFIPAEERRCTDFFCLLLFAVFLLGFAAVGIVGFLVGEPWALVYGTDYQGNTCGLDSFESTHLTAYPRVNEDLVYNSMQSSPLDYKFYGVCVSECPSKGDFVCNYNIDRAVYTDEVLYNCWNSQSYSPGGAANCGTARDNCWYQTLDTSEILYRCVPLYNVTSATTVRCTFPAYITDASDPRCILAEEETDTKTERPAQENMLFEQLSSYAMVVSRAFADVQQAWWVILLCAGGLSVVFSFTLFKFVELCTGLMVWLIVILTIVVNILFTLYCYVKADIIDPTAVVSVYEEAFDAEGSIEVPQQLSASDENGKWFEVTAYVWTGITFILICILIALRNEIAASINIMKLGSRAVQGMPLMAFYPFFSTILIVGFLAYWVYAAAALGTAGDIELSDVVSAASESAIASMFPGFNATEIYEDYIATNNTMVASFESMTTVQYMLVFHFFGGLWIVNFIDGVGIMTIAGATAAWYFSLDGRERNRNYGPALRQWKEDHGWVKARGKSSASSMAAVVQGGSNDALAGTSAAGQTMGAEEDVPEVLNGHQVPKLRLYRRGGPLGSREVCSSFCITCHKHIGTVAYGSLLIAFVQFVRAVFAYMEKQLSKYENSTMRYVRACIHYCLWMLEQCIKFVTRNAYIFTAMKGYSFCKSARSVFLLVLSKAKLLVAVNLISAFLVFLGKVAVALLCSLVAFQLLDSVSEFQEGGASEIESPYLSVIIVLLFSFFVSSAFFGVLDLSVDTILIAYVTDMDESKRVNPSLRRETPLHYLPASTSAGCCACCRGTKSADDQLSEATAKYEADAARDADVKSVTVSSAAPQGPGAAAAAAAAN